MAITRAQQAKQLLALGGRIGLQEGGGIEQRLEQLGGDVTSAEQMLQGINKRLETAESSLGSSGGGLGSIAQPLPGVGPNVGTLIPQPRPGPFMGRPILEPLIEGPVQPLATLEAVQPLAGSPIQEPTVLEAKPAEPFDPNKPNLRPFKFQPNVHTGLFHNYDTAEAGYEAAVADAKRMRDEGFKGRTELTGEMGFDRFKNIFDNLNNPNLIEKNYLASLNQRSGIPAAGYADGGITSLQEPRQGYFLGKIVKKAKKAVKKVVKSPVGKAAILGALTFGIPGTQFGGLAGGKGLGSFFGKGSFNPFMAKGKFSGLGSLLNKAGLVSGTGGLTGLGKLATIGGLSGLGGLMAAKEAEDEEGIDISDIDRGEGLNILDIVARARKNDPEFRFLPGAEFTGTYAEGGRINLANGGNGKILDPFQALVNYYLEMGASQSEAESLATNDYEKGIDAPKKKAEGGLMNLGGMEMDLRGGGFVPIGAKEKADDVPARLSKNEFVMTADAVRAAGGGSVDKGADKMYNLMKDLESRV